MFATIDVNPSSKTKILGPVSGTSLLMFDLSCIAAEALFLFCDGKTNSLSTFAFVPRRGKEACLHKCNHFDCIQGKIIWIINVLPCACGVCVCKLTSKLTVGPDPDSFNHLLRQTFIQKTCFPQLPLIFILWRNR